MTVEELHLAMTGDVGVRVERPDVNAFELGGLNSFYAWDFALTALHARLKRCEQDLSPRVDPLLTSLL
jgi:hypothetical protein